MPVKKEDNNSWTVQCYYTDWTGNKKHKKKRGFKTKREALQWERDFLAKGSAINLPMKKFVDIYFEDKKYEIKERTKMTKRHMIEKHIIPYFGEMQISKINAPQIIKWQNDIITKGYSDSYLRNIQNQLTALFVHACKIYNLPENPCVKVSRMGKYDNRRLEFWTVEEYEAFIETFDKGSMYHTIFETLFWTGMREGELLALTPADINFANKQIHITKTYYRRNKTDYITKPKTEQSVRTIDVPAFLLVELKNYMATIYDLHDDDRIFPVVAEAVQHTLKGRIEKYGFKKIRVHDIRHSHVSFLINQGVDPLIIKERLGHKDIKITLNTYGHLYPSKQKEVANMLDQIKTDKEG